MGQAREVMDRLTDALMATKDLKAVAACYAEDATAVTPDEGELTGRERVVDYLRKTLDAFPDVRYESMHKHESDNCAIDEGMIIGTNTGPLPMPTGDSLPATGKEIRVRGCDIATVEGGLITEHRFYFDQMEFLGQLGLLPEMPS